MRLLTFPTSTEMPGTWAVVAETGRGQSGDLAWLIKLNNNGSLSRQSKCSKNVSQAAIAEHGVAA